LVRERIRDWMQEHSPDRAGWTEDEIRLAYAQLLAQLRPAALLAPLQLAQIGHQLLPRTPPPENLEK
jgi:hypothetical protein